MHAPATDSKESGSEPLSESASSLEGQGSGLLDFAARLGAEIERNWTIIEKPMLNLGDLAPGGELEPRGVRLTSPVLQNGSVDLAGLAESSVALAGLRLICAGATRLSFQSLVGSIGFGVSGQLGSYETELARACERLAVPTLEGINSPHPTAQGDVGQIVGWMAEQAHRTPPAFQSAGDIVLLLGLPIISSTWTPPDTASVAAFQEAVRALIYGGSVKSAHACGLGGLAFHLAASCFGMGMDPNSPGFLGAVLDISSIAGVEDERLLFGAIPNHALLTVPAIQAGKLIVQAKIFDVPAVRIGVVGGDVLSIKTGRATYTVTSPEVQLAIQRQSQVPTL